MWGAACLTIPDSSRGGHEPGGQAIPQGLTSGPTAERVKRKET